jgi:hypothetical protein
MEAMRAQFERDAELESPWTGYNSALARPLLNTRKFLKAVEQAQPETVSIAAPAE